MAKFSFENIHRNKKWAFIDGFLCGLFTYALVKLFVDNSDENRLLDKAEDKLLADEPIPTPN